MMQLQAASALSCYEYAADSSRAKLHLRLQTRDSLPFSLLATASARNCGPVASIPVTADRA